MGNVLLIFFGVLGMGALLISLYVFTVSARRFVSEDETVSPGNSRRFSDQAANEEDWRPRGRDRRRNSGIVAFPLVIDGEVVAEDRRSGSERRRREDRRRTRA